MLPPLTGRHRAAFGGETISFHSNTFFMANQNDVNAIPILERNAPGTDWRFDGQDPTTGNQYCSTAARAFELPGEFMLGLYASGIRIAKIRVKRSGLIARLTLELIIP